MSVRDTARRRDDLAAAAVDGLRIDQCVEDLELDLRGNGSRWRCAAAVTLRIRRDVTLRIGSSHSGPSRVPHWKPCTIDSRAAESSDLFTCRPMRARQFRGGAGGAGHGRPRRRARHSMARHSTAQHGSVAGPSHRARR